MKHKLTTLLLFFAIAVAYATPPEGYYEDLNNLSGKALFDAVHVVAKKGYSSLSYSGLWTAYSKTDLRADGKIWDMYGDCDFTFSSDQCGIYSVECDCYNREHSIPKSWFGGAESDVGADIFHIVPTDGKVNGMRSSFAFGEVTAPTYTSGNGSKLGPSIAVSISNTILGAALSKQDPNTRVFEPIDEYKGDFARGYFGTMVRWANGDYQTFTSGDGAKMFSTGYTAAQNYGLTDYGVALLMKWHRQDPVSQKEINRNDGIQATQGNRNPFIDHPELAEYIWGNKAGDVFTIGEESVVPDQEDPAGPTVSPEFEELVNGLPTHTVSNGTLQLVALLPNSHVVIRSQDNNIAAERDCSANETFDLATGTYLLTIQVGGESVSVKVVVK